MNIAICDESIEVGEYIRIQASSYLRENSIFSECLVFNSIVDLMASGKVFDIVFLETGFSNLSSAQIGNFLKRQNEAVALILISEDYSFINDALNLGAARYLLKPVSKEILFEAMDAAIDFLDKETAECYLEENGTVKRISKASIVYLEISGRKTKVVTNNELLTSKIKMQDFQKHLSPAQFASPHKSFYVNMGQISEYRRFGGQYYICMSDNKYIPITRTRKAEFEKAYSQFLKRKKIM